MKLERVDREEINKLFRHTKIQRILSDFHNMDCNAVRCVFSNDEYSTPQVAQQTYSKAIKHLGYRMVARTINGELYLIKLD